MKSFPSSFLPDQRMKKWPGGNREFEVRVIGEKPQTKRIRFAGKRIDAEF
jgi:hypothetical protein